MTAYRYTVVSRMVIFPDETDGSVTMYAVPEGKKLNGAPVLPHLPLSFPALSCPPLPFSPPSLEVGPLKCS